MSSKNFAIWTNETKTAANITAAMQHGNHVDLFISDWIKNDSGTVYNSLQVKINYSNLAPNIGSFSVGALVEVEEDNGDITTLAYQFSPLRSSGQAPERVIILQPNLSTFDAGIDDIVYPVDEELSRISRQQGFLPESRIRVKILLKDSDPDGPGGFQAVTVTAAGRMYNV